MAGASSSKRPRQSDLKRAISTAYYAMFHALCENCADCLIGGKSANRSSPAWRQAYRSVEHKYSKSQCSNKQTMSKFPKDIEDFAHLYHELQVDRHSADYDPISSYSRSDTIGKIDAAELAIKALKSSSIKDRRAFAAWTAMKNRQD